MTTTDDFLASKGKTLKPEHEGDVVRIVLHAHKREQMTDFITGDPRWWDEQKTQPVEQHVFTGTSDGEDAKLYLKTWGLQNRALMDCLSKHPGVAIEGGTLAVKWESTEAPTKAGLSGTKVYKMQFEPKQTVLAPDDDLI